MSYLTMPALIGPVIGPPLGGFIVTYGSWRWIFCINIPIGLLGISWSRLFIDQYPRGSALRPFDLRGFVLTGIGLASLAFGFETVGRGTLADRSSSGCSRRRRSACALYVAARATVAHPIIDLAPAAGSRPSAAASIGGFLFRIGIGALPFLLPLMLQVGFGLNPLTRASSLSPAPPAR